MATSRKAEVERVVREHPDWSNRQVAAEVGMSHTMVARYRAGPRVPRIVAPERPAAVSPVPEDPGERFGWLIEQLAELALTYKEWSRGWADGLTGGQMTRADQQLASIQKLTAIGRAGIARRTQKR